MSVDNVSRYRVGVDYSLQMNAAIISYDAPAPKTGTPLACKAGDAGSGTNHCIAALFPTAGTGWGMFIQKRFERQGWAYFDFGVNGGVRTLQTSLMKQFDQVIANGGTLDPSASPSVDAEPQAPPDPITSMSTHLTGIAANGYVQVGLTPRYLPDLLLTTQTGAEILTGTIEVNGSSNWQTFLIPTAGAQVELVWSRFGSGALSSYLGEDIPLLAASQVKVPDANGVNQGIANVRMSLLSVSVGLLKLVIPIPY
jgi:hypothetical protein